MRGATLWMLTAVTLAGCLGPVAEPGEGAGDTAVAATVLPWSLTDCRYVVAFTVVPTANLEPYLPAGFTARTSDGLTGDGTLFGFDAITCAEGEGQTGADGALYAMFWASADPPQDALVEGVDPAEHYVKWDVLVPDDARRGLLAERGVPVRSGTVAVAHGGAGGLVTLEAAAAFDGLGAFRVTATGLDDRGTPSGPFVKFTPADGGAAPWYAEFVTDWSVSGRGILDLEPGSWPAEVVGADEARVTLHTGEWSYENGSITLPPS